MEATVVIPSYHIPGYQIKKQIGCGAMAAVYLATQVSLDRQVALKIMAASLVNDQSFCERFLKEGKIVAQLTHPHIVTIYDIGVFRFCYYMAMEYIGGGTLKSRLQQGLSVEQSVAILCQIAAALGYAHKRGFIHRDVKPANILFREEGTAVLSDFGIAKTLGDGTQLTAAGWTIGTPNYMSPEQALGKPADARSDLYSLGIVFYEMLTGVKPYQSEDSFATALMHVNSPVPQLPKELARFQGILDRLLAKDPKERFASAEELLKAIPAVAIGRTPKTPARRNVTAAGVGARRSRYLIWPLGLGVFLSVSGTGLYFLIMDKPAVELPAVELVTPLPDGQPSPLPQPPSLSPQTQEQIAQLLRIATAHYEVQRWTDPPGSNAADAYQRVLELDPQNAQALAGLKTIADQYEAMARERLEKHDIAGGLDYVEIGLNVVPRHRGLLRLRDEINRQMQ